MNSTRTHSVQNKRGVFYLQNLPHPEGTHPKSVLFSRHPSAERELYALLGNERKRTQVKITKINTRNALQGSPPKRHFSCDLLASLRWFPSDFGTHRAARKAFWENPYLCLAACEEVVWFRADFLRGLPCRGNCKYFATVAEGKVYMQATWYIKEETRLLT